MSDLRRKTLGLLGCAGAGAGCPDTGADAGAAAGGTVTVTSGNAARLTSGNANGGDISLALGAGIGTGNAGRVLMPTGQLLLGGGGATNGSNALQEAWYWAVSIVSVSLMGPFAPPRRSLADSAVGAARR